MGDHGKSPREEGMLVAKLTLASCWYWYQICINLPINRYVRYDKTNIRIEQSCIQSRMYSLHTPLVRPYFLGGTLNTMTESSQNFAIPHYSTIFNMTLLVIKSHMLYFISGHLQIKKAKVS